MLPASFTNEATQYIRASSAAPKLIYIGRDMRRPISAGRLDMPAGVADDGPKICDCRAQTRCDMMTRRIYLTIRMQLAIDFERQ